MELASSPDSKNSMLVFFPQKNRKESEDTHSPQYAEGTQKQT